MLNNRSFLMLALAACIAFSAWAVEPSTNLSSYYAGRERWTFYTQTGAPMYLYKLKSAE